MGGGGGGGGGRDPTPPALLIVELFGVSERPLIYVLPEDTATVSHLVQSIRRDDIDLARLLSYIPLPHSLPLRLLRGVPVTGLLANGWVSFIRIS
ncbi:hypothetical protein IWQ57_001910 [Coemansia nantahalensis]|uniref:Uncharacterized protein n=1 Tax=Coemansia nantahalensis TaxID=2789366 RepID=A0ACC1K288_9FUNG|nr:hypothetical protein IWQ57_001910 [Coemansia nantahalensis]